MTAVNVFPSVVKNFSVKLKNTTSLNCRQTFLDMYQEFLRCFPKEDYLIDILEYLRMSTDHILGMVPDLVEDDDTAEEEKEHCDHPLESISIGVLDTRSFLFFYDEDDNKENMKAMASKGQKVQRSNSDRVVPKKTIESQKSVPANTKLNNNNKTAPGKKCPKIESLQKSDSKVGPKSKF